MAMHAPQTDQDLDTHLEENQIRAQQHLVGLVSPDGSVSHTVAEPGPEGANGQVHGFDICRWIEGEPQLTLYAKRKGWTLLEQRCKDEGVEGRYATWLGVMRSRMPPNAQEVEMPMVKGSKPPRTDMTMVYPPSVIQMRDKGGEQQARLRLVKGKGIVAILEDGTSGDVVSSPERIRHLAGELGMTDG